MIGSWSNRIIDESRCHTRDRHALDGPNQDVNYVTLWEPESFVIFAGWPGGVPAGLFFWLLVRVMARLSRRAGWVPRVLVVSLLGCREGLSWSAGREGLGAGDRSGGLLCPEPGRSEAQPNAAHAADNAPGDREQAQPPGFPPARGIGERKHLHRGEQLAGQGDDLSPDLVLDVAVQGQVAQARVPWRSGCGPRTGPGGGGVVPDRRAARPWC
jgi:hypothetical protein